MNNNEMAFFSCAEDLSSRIASNITKYAFYYHFSFYTAKAFYYATDTCFSILLKFD